MPDRSRRKRHLCSGHGVFRMSMPRAWGGPEVDLLEQVEILEGCTDADASCRVVRHAAPTAGFYSAARSDADAREIYPELDSVAAGWIMPAGTLEITDGGYRLSGHWSFGSGCTHAASQPGIPSDSTGHGARAPSTAGPPCSSPISWASHSVRRPTRSNSLWRSLTARSACPTGSWPETSRGCAPVGPRAGHGRIGPQLRL